MGSCIIGLGNELRRDDAIGLEIVKQLQMIPMGVDSYQFSNSFFELPDILANYDMAFVIDAVPPVEQPGRISMMEYVMNCGVQHERYSLHDMELFWGLQYAYARGFAGRVFLIGVEVDDLSLGMGLSLSLRERLLHLVKEVKTLVLAICNNPIRGIP